jgi:RNA-binding protein YhbY
MCTPQAAMAGAQGAMNFAIEDYNSRKQVAFQEQRARDTAANVQEDVTRQYAAISRRSGERDRNAARQIQELERQARAARGSTRTQAGASGVEGTTVNDALADFTRQELLRVELTREQRDTERYNTGNELEAIKNQGEARIVQAAGGPVARPNIFGALFQVASAGLQGYMDATAVNPETGGREWQGGFMSRPSKNS